MTIQSIIGHRELTSGVDSLKRVLVACMGRAVLSQNEVFKILDNLQLTRGELENLQIFAGRCVREIDDVNSDMDDIITNYMYKTRT